MKKIIFGFIIGIILASTITVVADKIPSPPPLDKESVEENFISIQHYFTEIFNNFHRLQVVDTSPNGSRNGKKGDMLHLQTGGKYYHCENIDSSTTWYCVELTNVP